MGSMFSHLDPSRRRFLQAFPSAPAVAALMGSVSQASGAGHSDWPAAVEWERLKEQVGGRLIRVKSVIEGLPRGAGWSSLRRSP